MAFGTLTRAASTSWQGVVSDDHCGKNHAMAGAAAAKCVGECVAKSERRGAWMCWRRESFAPGSQYQL